MFNIYVGNLPFTTTDEDLKQRFAEYGEIQRAVVIMDRDTKKSRGFGFVEMANDADGEAAVESEDGTDMDGRALKVTKAKEREDNRR
jgi:RNA recognition motif-containing protein